MAKTLESNLQKLQYCKCFLKFHSINMISKCKNTYFLALSENILAYFSKHILRHFLCLYDCRQIRGYQSTELCNSPWLICTENYRTWRSWAQNKCPLAFDRHQTLQSRDDLAAVFLPTCQLRSYNTMSVIII